MIRKVFQSNAKGEGGFTLIELLIVVAILGILAAVVIPNVGRFLGRGETEAENAEFQSLITATNAMMVDNNISTIPNIVAPNTAPCTTGTKVMSAFPDTASLAGSADKLEDPNGNTYVDGIDPAGDKDGYLLYTHDITGNTDQAALVNYMTVENASYCYTVVADGSVTQFGTDGVQTNP